MSNLDKALNLLDGHGPAVNEETKQEIKKVFLELIGEDTPRDYNVSVQGKANMTRRARNTLRAELRQKVEEL